MTEVQESVETQILGLATTLNDGISTQIQGIADTLADTGNITITYDTAVFDSQISEIDTKITQQSANIDTTMQNIELSVNETVAGLEVQYQNQIDTINADTEAFIQQNNQKLNERLENITASFDPIKSELDIIANNTEAIAQVAREAADRIENQTKKFIMDQVGITQEGIDKLNNLDEEFGKFTFSAEQLPVLTNSIMWAAFVISIINLLVNIYYLIRWIYKKCCGKGIVSSAYNKVQII